VNGGCDSPGIAFNRDEVSEGGVLKWSVAGPAGADVVITADDTPVTSPDRLLGPVRIGSGCKASGLFGVPLKDGTHTLRVTLIQDGAPREIGTTRIEVNRLP
jgi:hypothetical protein